MSAILNAATFLNHKNELLTGNFSYSLQNSTFIFHPIKNNLKQFAGPYFVEGIPIDVHFHGIGEIDFSGDIEKIEFDTIQKYLEEENIFGIPTIFLRYERLNSFLDMMDRFYERKKNGELQNIIGFSLEGPILLSQGGTPAKGSWSPTTTEWEKLAACGKKGLKYMVISPDWELKKLLAVTELLFSNGIYVSLGHCRSDYIQQAVEGIYAVSDLAEKMGYKTHSGAVSVDHLFNDMPHTFKHAWRSVTERRQRTQDLVNINVDGWNLKSISEQVGEVPGALIKLAHKGKVTIFLNFDGQHVDLQICRRVYELVGADNIVPMTDRMETNSFCGYPLTKRDIGTLWYQRSGAVAVGCSTLDEQMTNMRALEIPEQDIWRMCALNPSRIFMDTIPDKPTYLTYVDKRKLRLGVDLNNNQYKFLSTN